MLAERQLTGAQLTKQVEVGRRAIMPPDWEMTSQREARARDRGYDLKLSVTAPDGARTTILVEVKANRFAGGVRAAVQQLRAVADASGAQDPALVVAAPYLSPTARRQIAEVGSGYFDLTGNVFLRCRRPALYIRQDGASKDPWPSDDTLRSLKGRGSARAVRALLDFAPPYGVRELAEKAGVPLGSLSRTIELLGKAAHPRRPWAGDRTRLGRSHPTLGRGLRRHVVEPGLDLSRTPGSDRPPGEVGEGIGLRGHGIIRDPAFLAGSADPSGVDIHR